MKADISTYEDDLKELRSEVNRLEELVLKKTSENNELHDTKAMKCKKTSFSNIREASNNARLEHSTHAIIERTPLT